MNVIEELVNLPTKISFELRKYSSKTNLVDIRTASFRKFIREDAELKNRNNKGVLRAPVYSCKIGQQEASYAWSINVAIYNALEKYKESRNKK